MGRKILAGALFALAVTGCLGLDQGSDQGTVVDIVPPEAVPDPSTFVCNPMDGEAGGARTQGIKGRLFYLDDTQPRYSSTADYIANGHAVTEVDLFFNQIYVPTRPFDRGFTTQSGVTLQDQTGDTLYEYFAIRHEGRIQLGGLPEGVYQFAILSDDGATLRMDFGNGFEEIINNDGNHPTRMGCTNIPVAIGAGDTIPFQLDYHQGPRYHVALILMARPWPSDPAQANDPLCGVQGNSTYFDYTQDPPTPKPSYNALLGRGWAPLAPENYLLPQENETNPCNEPAPVISNFRATVIGATTMTLQWDTDRPATSQVQYQLQTGGTPVLTDSDGQFRSSHSVTVSGLTSNTVYLFRAVSASVSGLSSESADLTIRTRR